jgi:hypothetical protein
MVEFNHTLLADLTIQGYKYFVFFRKEEKIVVVPLKKPVPEEQLKFLGYVQLELNDIKAMETIKKIDLLNEFKTYIPKEYFEDAGAASPES